MEIEIDIIFNQFSTKLSIESFRQNIFSLEKNRTFLILILTFTKTGLLNSGSVVDILKLSSKYFDVSHSLWCSEETVCAELKSMKQSFKKSGYNPRNYFESCISWMHCITLMRHWPVYERENCPSSNWRNRFYEWIV